MNEDQSASASNNAANNDEVPSILPTTTSSSSDAKLAYSCPPTTTDINSLASLFRGSQILGQTDIYFLMNPHDSSKLDRTVSSMLLVLEMEAKDHGKASPIQSPLRY